MAAGLYATATGNPLAPFKAQGRARNSRCRISNARSIASSAFLTPTQSGYPVGAATSKVARLGASEVQGLSSGFQMISQR
jgi:hypothetical protein